MKISRCFSLFCLLATVAAASHAPASEKSGVGQQNGAALQVTEPARLSQWNAFLETIWLPGSGIDGSGGDVEMEEVKVGFGRQFKPSSLFQLSAGLSYCLINIDAPEGVRLPESLHAVSLSLGGDYQVTDDLILGVNISPGLSSDFEEIDTDDIRVQAAVYGRYGVSRRLILLGGAKYKGGDGNLPVVPVIGVQYRPSERWTFDLGVPRSTIIFMLKKGTSLCIGAQLSTGGTYELHDTSLGADSISYNDYRAFAGVEFPLSGIVKLGLSGGYAFGREFEFSDGNRDDLDLDDTPFARLELKFAW